MKARGAGGCSLQAEQQILLNYKDSQEYDKGCKSSTDAELIFCCIHTGLFPKALSTISSTDFINTQEKTFQKIRVYFEGIEDMKRCLFGVGLDDF